VVRTLDCPAAPNPAWDAERPECATSSAPYRVYNIGNNQPVNLLDFVATLEEIIGKPAIRDLLPMQAGDVLETCADISAMQRDVGFSPRRRWPRDCAGLSNGTAVTTAWQVNRPIHGRAGSIGAMPRYAQQPRPTRWSSTKRSGGL